MPAGRVGAGNPGAILRFRTHTKSSGAPKCAAHRTTSANNKRAPKYRFCLGVSGNPRRLLAQSCNANNEKGDKPLAPEPSAVLLPAQRHRSSKGEAMTTKPDLPILPFASRDAWEAW